MVHGRMVRPAVAGAVPVNVDESSIKEIPGARVVWNQGFLGVVADKEWDAIKAARELKVTWSNPAPPFPDQASLYDHIRKAPVRKSETEGKPVGDVDAALKNAARVIEAEYEWPFQSHASMGPACAVVDIKGNQVTVWPGSQKPHFTRDGVAKILGVSTDKVRGIWTLGPGSYGRNDAGDWAMDAALLANAVGRPVRLQYMRDQATGWDPKAPASIHRARAVIDPSGKVIAYEFMSNRAWTSIQTRARHTILWRDSGQIINPDGLMRVIEAGVVQGISRALWEEVKFDTNSVTSVDWLSYPILDIAEAPEAIDVVLIDRPEIPPSGAGEPAIRPVAAAIANAIFDATGVRIRRVPFSPDNVKSALS